MLLSKETNNLELAISQILQDSISCFEGYELFECTLRYVVFEKGSKILCLFKVDESDDFVVAS